MSEYPAKPESLADGKAPKETSLLQDVAALTMKLAVLFAVFWLMFNYVFGVERYLSANMMPSLRDGDLVLYFRMDHSFDAGDIAVFSYEGRTLMGSHTENYHGGSGDQSCALRSDTEADGDDYEYGRDVGSREVKQ